MPTRSILTAVAMLLVGAASPVRAQPAATARDWAFPAPPLPWAGNPNKSHTLPGSTMRYTDAQLHDLTRAPDWFPGAHPPLPAAIALGRGGAKACAFCHLPGGEGRPENASLAGLPADYIRRQVAALASGARTGVRPGWGPTSRMIATAKASDPVEVARAAAYFSARPFVSHVRVVEGDIVPRAEPYKGVYELRGGGTMPLGKRIIEGPCVDGSPLARAFLSICTFVGRCGHVFDL